VAEQAIHLLDCVRWLLDEARVVRATGLGAKNMSQDRPEFDADSSMQLVYELTGGVFGTHLNHCGHERFAFDLELVGPTLRLQANVTENCIRGYLNGEAVESTPPARNSIGVDKTQAWLLAIRDGDRSLIRSDFRDATRSLELVACIQAGMQAGRFTGPGDLAT
jgi:predicted dehydrogenase